LYNFDREISRMMGRWCARSYSFNPLDLMNYPEGTVNPTALMSRLQRAQKDG